MKNLTLSFTIIIKGCMTKNMTPEQIAEQLNEHVQHEVKNLNIPAVIKSVCEFGLNPDNCIRKADTCFKCLPKQ